VATVLDLNFDGGSQGTTATTTNTALGGTGTFDAMEATETFDSAVAQHGLYGLKSSATASAYARKDYSSTTVSYRVGFRYGGLPTDSGAYMLRVAIGTTYYVSVRVVNGTGKLRIEDAAVANRWTATNALVQNTDYWFEIMVDSGTTTTDGKITFDYYPKDSTTPVETGLVDTTANCGAGVTFTRAYMLKWGSGPQFSFDDLKLATGFARIGPAPISTLAATASLTAAGIVTAITAATLAATVAITSAGSVSASGLSSAATLAITSTTTAAGVVAASTGAARTSTATVTAAGVVNTTGAATGGYTVTITSAGSVVSGGSGSASLTSSATITAAGQVAIITAANLTATATRTATGTVSTASSASLTATATIAAGGTASGAIIYTITTERTYRIPAATHAMTNTDRRTATLPASIHTATAATQSRTYRIPPKSGGTL